MFKVLFNPELSSMFEKGQIQEIIEEMQNFTSRVDSSRVVWTPATWPATAAILVAEF